MALFPIDLIEISTDNIKMNECECELRYYICLSGLIVVDFNNIVLESVFIAYRENSWHESVEDTNSMVVMNTHCKRDFGWRINFKWEYQS